MFEGGAMSYWGDILNGEVNEINDPTRRLQVPAYKSLSIPKIKSWKEGHVSATWAVKKELFTALGDLFGGYYGVLSDVALSYAAMTVLGDEEAFKTTDLHLTYFRPAVEGDMEIEGVVVNRSKTLIHAEAFFRNEKGKLLAKASTTFVIVPMKSRQ
jgi:uncharacterized protein (TIGR00369 family)